MVVYDGYHREMLFKVICMQNNLGSYGKYDEK